MKLQAQSQANDERIALQQFTQNPDNWQTDGNIDMGKLNAAVPKLAPMTGGDVLEKFSILNKAQTDANIAKTSLNTTQLGLLGQRLTAYGAAAQQDPSLQTPQAAKQVVDQWAADYPNDSNVKKLVTSYATTLSMSQPGPHIAQVAMQAGQAMGLTTAQQSQAMAPSGVNVSNGIQTGTVNTNPIASGGVGSLIPGTVQTQQVPLGSQQKPFQDQQQNWWVQHTDANGNITGVTRMPGSGAPGTPGALPHFTPGQPDDIKAAQQEVQSVRSAADQVGTQANINKKILQLSRNTSTGPGTDSVKSWVGMIPGVNFNDHQELGKYLEKNAIASMQAMGGSPSDARLNAAMAANGSTQYSAGALQDVTKFNDAATTALGQYRQGLDKAVGLKSSDYTALPTFKSAWAANLDPNVFRVENALRDGDTMELQKLKTELGPQGLAALAKKRLNLQTLSQTGRLPQ